MATVKPVEVQHFLTTPAPKTCVPRVARLLQAEQSCPVHERAISSRFVGD